jgi:hypothetical protein
MFKDEGLASVSTTIVRDKESGQMPKRKMTLDLSLPRYPLKAMKGDRSGANPGPGLRWRRDVFEAIRKTARDRGVAYTDRDRLQVKLLLRLNPSQMRSFDVDNLVKHVGDALQGSLAGNGKKVPHDREAVLPNDWQISLWRVEKVVTNTATKHKPHLLVQRYKASTT